MIPGWVASGDGAPLPDAPSGASLAGLSVSGVASWYCNADPSRGPLSPCHADYPDTGLPDYYAAAGPGLRTGDWRGRYVTVTYQGKSIVVQLIDACGAGCSVLIDLYADAFAELAPLGTGRITVGVSPTPPATDTETP